MASDMRPKAATHSTSMYPDIAAWLDRCGEAYHVIRLAGTPLQTPSNTTRASHPPENRHTGTQQWNGLRERDQGALVALVTRARTAARPESTEIAMSGWPMEQVPRKLTAGISFPGKKNAAVAMKQLRLLSRGHVHTDTLPALFVHCHGIIRLSLSAPEIRQGSVSPERGTRVPRRRRRDRNPSMPLIAGPSQHSRASSARDCPSGSGPRLCDRKSPLS